MLVTVEYFSTQSTQGFRFERYNEGRVKRALSAQQSLDSVGVAGAFLEAETENRGGHLGGKPNSCNSRHLL
nr:unnamed protein product [Haemonchus contortus]